MKRAISVLLCTILSLIPFLSCFSEYSFSRDPDAIEEAINSVLFIVIFDKDDELIATGSGFIAFTNRTIVTNYHVVEGAENVYAVDEKDNFFVIDRIIAADEEKDIAILSFKSTINLTPLRLNENPNLKRGQPVVAIGSPEGLKNSVSTGIISSLYDRDDVPEIQFTASISHGSSGGALFNDAGEVIGITSGMYEEGQNLNFAIGIYHVIDLYRKYFPNYIQLQPTATSTAGIANQPTLTRAPTATPVQNSFHAPSIKTIQAMDNGVYLQWSAVVGSVEYQILRSSTANGNYQVLDTIPGNYFFDSSINAGSKYYYRIAVVDTKTKAKATSDAEEILVLVQTPSQTPKPTQKPTPTAIPKLLPPKNVEATVKGKSIILTWSAVDGATQYRVYRSNSEKGTYLYNASTTILSYEDSNIEEGKTYYYKVESENRAVGFSEKSKYIKAMVPKPTPIPTPSPTPSPISHITPDEIAKYKTLKIGMNDPDVARLKERMYELGYFKNKTVNNNFTETTAEYVKEFQRANGLKADGIASPEMQALFFSEYAIPKPSPTPSPTPRLSTPRNVKASVSGMTVTITWSAVKGSEYYNIYRSTKPNHLYGLLGTASSTKFV